MRGKTPNRDRNRAIESKRIDLQYFCRTLPNRVPMFQDAVFSRRFSVTRTVFETVRQTLITRIPFFGQKKDALGVPGATIDQKLCAALHLLCSGGSMDSVVDKFGIAESIVNA